MIKNKIMYKVSLACVLSVLATGAYAARSFSFTVPAGTPGDSCSVASVVPIDGGQELNMLCGNTTTKITIPNGAQGAQGASGTSCSVKSVTSAENRTNVTLTCGDQEETIEIPNGQDGTSCNITAERDDNSNRVAITKSCGTETPETVYVNDGETPNIDTVAIAAANKITAAGTFATPGDVTNATSTESLTNKLNGVFATPTELTALNNKLPALDASTGAMTWTDPNGNSASYGHYTFWYSGTYNKKINSKWFKCNRYYTDAPTTSYVQNQVENMYCSSGEGWAYGTDCLLDGSITAYDEAIPGNGIFPNWKFKVCWEIKSGDITSLIDEQVAAKGYATTGALSNFYTIQETNSAIDAAIANAELGELDDEAVRKIVQDVMGDSTAFVTTNDFNTYQTQTAATLSELQSDKLDAADLETAAATAGLVTTSAMNTAIGTAVADATKLQALTTTLAGTYAPASLETTVSTLSNTKADASTVTALQTTVSGKADKDEVTALQTAVADKANQSDLDALQDTVNTVQTTANEALPAANFGTVLKSDAQKTNVAAAVNASGALDPYATKDEVAAATMCDGTIGVRQDGNRVTITCDDGKD